MLFLFSCRSDETWKIYKITTISLSIITIAIFNKAIKRGTINIMIIIGNTVKKSNVYTTIMNNVKLFMSYNVT